MRQNVIRERFPSSLNQETREASLIIDSPNDWKLCNTACLLILCLSGGTLSFDD